MARRPLWHILLFAVPVTLVAVLAPRLPAGPIHDWMVLSPLDFLVGVVIAALAAHLLLQTARPASWLRVGLLGVDEERQTVEERESGRAGEWENGGVEEWESGGVASATQPPIHPTIHPPIHPSTHTSIHPDIHPPTHPPILGFLVLLAGLGIAEAMQPMFFTQDDNLSQFLPVILQGCHSLAHGVFPTWNPYQFMGSPTTIMGVYSLTYPPIYIAYVVARYAVGNEYLTLDVFCIGHLLVGYWVTYKAARALGLSAWLSAAGSVAFVLSGFTLVAGRSWYYMTPVVVWFPLLVNSAVQVHRRRVGPGWALWAGLVIGIWFHAGNAQMWMYGVLFWLLAILLGSWSGSMPRGRVIWVIPALLLGGAVAAPLLVPQAAAASQITRYLGGDISIRPGLPGLILPSTLFKAVETPLGGSTDTRYTGELYYSGSVFCLAALLGLGSLAAFRWSREVVGKNPWLVCAGVAFILALGEAGLAWSLMSLVPPFNKFEDAFKFLPFFNLFAVLGGGLIIQRWINGYCKRSGAPARAAIVQATLAVLVSGLMLYHCSLCRASFYNYGFKPYPSLPPTFRALLVGQSTVANGVMEPIDPGPKPSAGSRPPPGARIISFAPLRSISPDFVRTLQLNFPTIYGVLSISGYDPLVEGTPENQALSRRLLSDPVVAARAYGVRWVVEHRGLLNHPVVTMAHYHHLERIHGLRLVQLDRLKAAAVGSHQFGDVTVWDLGSEDALAFVESTPQSALPIKLNGSGAEVDVRGLHGASPIIVNVLFRPQMVAFIDGRSAPISVDAWGRVRVNVPVNAHVVEIRQIVPWGAGLAFAAVLALASFGATRLAERKG